MTSTLRSVGTPAPAHVQAAADMFWCAGGYAAAWIALVTAFAYTFAVIRAVLG